SRPGGQPGGGPAQRGAGALQALGETGGAVDVDDLPAHRGEVEVAGPGDGAAGGGDQRRPLGAGLVGAAALQGAGVDDPRGGGGDGPPVQVPQGPVLVAQAGQGAFGRRARAAGPAAVPDADVDEIGRAH